MLALRDVKKYYGDTRALDGLDLEVQPGEVLGIAGPNGAGKSTMIRILAGEETPSAGEVLLDGRDWSAFAAEGRVAIVHQEPQLFPNLTLAENLMVGRESSRINRPSLSAADLAILGELEIREQAPVRLDRLSLAIQQRTEIARALARDAQLFLFDEPNSALTEEESTELFRRMRSLADRGRFVLFVSHRLAELVRHSDRVAVIRDGRCATILSGAAVTQEAVARALVVEASGVEAAVREARQHGPGPRLLHVAGWAHAGGAFAADEFSVSDGEIVAIVGVEGSGAREFVSSLAGFEPIIGSVEIAGLSGRASLRALTVYIPASRRASLFPNFSVAENVVARLGVGDIGRHGGLLQRGRVHELAQAARQRFRIRCASVRQSIRALSGGNQQKVVIAAALSKRPRLLVAEEPTRGVDIGSKAEIYGLLQRFAAEGNGVLMYCTEVPEVFEAADRVFVMDAGRLSDPLDVHAYSGVEELAADIAALERHTRGADASATA